MPLNTLKGLLIDQLSELYAAEKHNAEVLPKLALAASNPRLAAVLRSHADETQEHIWRLENVFEGLGMAPRRVESKGMKGLREDCLKLAGMPKADPRVRDAALIAVAQHVEHDEIAGYGCARTWARLLGKSSGATLLEKTLEEEKASDARLSKLADSLNRAALEPAMA